MRRGSAASVCIIREPKCRSSTPIKLLRPARSGVVRQWLETAISLDETTVGRELKALGFARSRRGRATTRKTSWPSPRRTGEDPGEAPERRRDRAVVAKMKPAPARRISSHADGPDVARARQPAHRMGLYLRRDLPAKGKGAGLVMPWCDTDAMAAHLIEISAAVDPGAHAVLIVDQAGWHLTPKLAIPDNITVLALPPRSPELNPVENVWQFMRDNWLSNRIFKSYEDIVALCCQAWNNLIDQPWKIMSLGMRKWADQ